MCLILQVGGKVIEGLARFIFQQLIIALDFCHRKGKVNRDIKLSNILLSISGVSIIPLLLAVGHWVPT
jgi:serine/threonine-protein kinase SRK2